MTSTAAPPTGVGLGLRWEFLEEVMDSAQLPIAFFEVSPENYMRRGGYYPASLAALRERYPIVTHGLTLSIGGACELNGDYLRELAAEVRRLGVSWHSDHLCFASAGRRALHDLFPLPFSEESLRRVSERARAVQDWLGRPFALENISYYATPAAGSMSEAEFVARAVEEANVELLLDVNNVYVNALNHGSDPLAFLSSMPLERVREIHVAGHGPPDAGLILDTHGTPVCSEVHALLEWVLERTGPVAVLLERDNDVPSLAELLGELATLNEIYDRALQRHQDRAERQRERSARAPALRCASSTATTQSALEEAVADLIFAGAARVPAERFLESATRPERPLVYRKLVRSTLRDALELAIPRTMARLGDAFEECFAAFLAEREFTSHYLRDVTSEFIEYLRLRSASDCRVLPYLVELAELEALHIEIAAAPEAAPNEAPSELALDASFVFTSAARSVRFSYAVHELSEDLADRGEPPRRAVRLLTYRSPDHNVRYLELSDLAAELLERLMAGATLQDAVLAAAAAGGYALDDAVLESTARWLADLSARGVLLGVKVGDGSASAHAAEQSTLSPCLSAPIPSQRTHHD